MMQFSLAARRLLAGLCAIGAIGLAGFAPVPAHASAASKALSVEIKAAPKYSGKVVSIDTINGKITIHNKKQGDMTFTLTDTTRYRVDKVKSTLASLKPGMKVTIHSADKTTALEINAHTKATTPAVPAP